MTVLAVVLIFAALVWAFTLLPGLPAWAAWLNRVALVLTIGCLVLDTLGVASARL